MQIRRVNTTHEYVLEKSETPLEIVPQIIRLFVEYIRPYGSTATVWEGTANPLVASSYPSHTSEIGRSIGLEVNF